MTEPPFTALGAALLAGAFGSAHCLGMCGGLAGLFAARLEPASLGRRLRLAVLYNVGRLLGYALLGFLAAGIGHTFTGVIPALAGPMRLAGGLLIVLIGLQLAFAWRPLAVLERGGARFWRQIAPVARGLVPITSTAKALALGALWGFLPCGLVYSALLVAASSGEALNGAGVMTAFGLGTLPAMLLTGLGAAQLQTFMSKTRTRRGAGLLVVTMGLITLWIPLGGLLAGFPGGDLHARH